MKHWSLWLIAGVLSILGGVMAFANPFAATMTVELLSGYALIFTGVFALIAAVMNRAWVSALLSVLILALGVCLVKNPLEGVLAITALTAVLLIAGGVSRALWAFALQGGTRWMLLLSALISVVLGVMIFNDLPQSAVVMLGVFLGFELISNGISLLFVAMATKNAPKVA